jgi:hypothetical protein
MSLPYPLPTFGVDVGLFVDRIIIYRVSMHLIYRSWTADGVMRRKRNQSLAHQPTQNMCRDKARNRGTLQSHG